MFALIKKAVRDEARLRMEEEYENRLRLLEEADVRLQESVLELKFQIREFYQIQNAKMEEQLRQKYSELEVGLREEYEIKIANAEHTKQIKADWKAHRQRMQRDLDEHADVIAIHGRRCRADNGRSTEMV
jgi:hypothetical protein